MTNPNGPSIEFQALTKLMDLAEDICDTKSRAKINNHLAKAAQVRYFLKALGFKAYLADTSVNVIYQCLIEVSEIYNFPTFAPLPPTSLPGVGSPLQGPPGPAGPAGIQGPAGATGAAGAAGFTIFSNAAVTLGAARTLDTFAKASTSATRWDWVAVGPSGKYRSGTIIADWDGASVEYATSTTVGLGSIGIGELVLTPVIFGTNVLLQATVTTSTWNIFGRRYTMS